MQLQKLGLSAVITLLTAVSMPIYETEAKKPLPTDQTVEKTSVSFLKNNINLAKEIARFLRSAGNNFSTNQPKIQE